MKKYIVLFLSFALLFACKEEKELIINVKTSEGNIKLKLYEETPLHRENFVKLVKEGYYNGMLFHRVIKDFMIQAGDPDSKRTRPGIALGANSIGYTIPQEIHSRFFHKKGALAAARESDNVNPQRNSDGSHFYIVKGKVFSPQELDAEVEYINNKRYTALFNRLKQERQAEIIKCQRDNEYEKLMEINRELSELTRKSFAEVKLTLTPEQRTAYTTVGGTPHLDGDYTVFGEVIEGIEVVDKISDKETDGNNRPLKDITIIKMEIVK